MIKKKQWDEYVKDTRIRGFKINFDRHLDPHTLLPTQKSTLGFEWYVDDLVPATKIFAYDPDHLYIEEYPDGKKKLVLKK